MRRPLALLVALLLVTIAAAPVEAATVRRVFGASVGTSGANGNIHITVMTDGTGQYAYALKGLRASTTYRVEVRKGRCSSLGSVVTRPSNIRTDGSGAFAAVRPTSSTSTLWSANMAGTLAIRIYAGTSIRCGNLGFVHATRVYMGRQGVLNATINLPIVRGPNGYPYCNVAMYMGALAQPREPGVTFIYAHARTGMFYPLYYRWKIGRTSSLVGKLFSLYTSDSQVSQYRVDRVRVAKNLNGVFGITSERAWLQTSTGPNYTYPKLIVEGRRISTTATTYAASHPKPRIVHCH